MAFDWLFGPRTRELTQGGAIAPRPVEIDVDTIREVSRYFKEHAIVAPADLDYSQTYYCDRGAVSDTDLEGLSDYDKSSLYSMLQLTGDPNLPGPTPNATAWVHYSGPGGARVQAGEDGGIRARPDLQYALANIIVENGTPRIQWHLLARLLPVVAWVALVASYAVMLVNVPLEPAVHVFLAATILLLTVGTVVLTRTIHVWATRRPTSLTIRGESRMQTRRRRADNHANRKNSLITLAIGVPISIVATALTILFGLKEP